MNIQRFQASTSREALAMARRALGEEVLILSSRNTDGGVEVLATPDDRELAADGPVRASGAREPVRRAVERDTERLAMSTLSFQEYVRERMSRKRDTPAAAAQPRQAPAANRAAPQRTASEGQAPRPAPAKAEPTPVARQIFDRLEAMESLIDERLTTMSWLGQTRQDPVAAQLLLQLLRAGYSSALARSIVEGLPLRGEPAATLRALVQELAARVHTDEGADGLVDEGGMLVLVGPSGAGKTTLAAKLAAQVVARHGQASVALVSVDNQRPGAHEQLRASARAHGLAAHVAEDLAALRELLGLFSRKKLVIVDTAGLNPAAADRIDPTGLPGVRSLLVLAACSHGEALEAAVLSAGRRACADAVLTKLDEAGKLGPALDVAMRHGLRLRGYSQGPRIPEDFARAQADELVRRSLRSQSQSPWSPVADDLGYHFNAPRGQAAAY